MSNDQVTVILKRFEAPDEVRVLQKGASSWCASGNDYWTRHLRAGMEVERTRRTERGRHALPGGACRSCLVGQSDGRVRRWYSIRSCEQAICFTFRRYHMIVGLSARSRTSPSTFLEPTTMPRQTHDQTAQLLCLSVVFSRASACWPYEDDFG